MEIVFKDYKYKDKKLSFTIKNNKINGLYGNHLNDLVDLIRLNSKEYSSIKIDGKELSKEIVFEKKKSISIVEETLEQDIHETNINEHLIEYMKQYEIYPKNLSKKIKDALKIVGLKEEILLKNIYGISSFEQKMIQLVKALLLNPEVIILDNTLAFLDMKQSKRLMMVLRKIKDQFKKTIVIISNDVNTLYQETEHLIIYKNNRILIEDSTDIVFQKVDFLKKHDIPIPDIVEFTYLVKKNKKVKLDYHKDVRDIIKDIYKHI